MSHTPHALAEEFAEFADKITALKGEDAHFDRLAADYQRVNTAVFHAETRLTPMSDEAEEKLRKERAAIKDQIWRYLK